MEHESNGYTNSHLCANYGHQVIGNRTRRPGNKRMDGDNPNFNTIEIGQDTENNSNILALDRAVN